MIVKAYRIEDTDKGRTVPSMVGEFEIYSWKIGAVQKAVKGGNLQVFDAQITSTQKLPDSAVIEIDSKWYMLATPAAGMLGMFRYFVTETVRPSNL